MRSVRPAARHRASSGERPAAEPAAIPDVFGRRGFAVACMVALVGVLTFCVLAASGVLDAKASVVLDDSGQLLGGLAAAVGGAFTGRTARPPDRAWRLLLALGMAGWTGGMVAWSWFQIVVGHELPSPSVADIGFFMLPLFLLPALMLFPARPRPADVAQSRRRPYVRMVLVLDSLVVVGSLFTLTWSTALDAAIRTDTQPLPTLLIALGYPLTDLMLVVFVVLLGTFRAPRNPRALLLLGLGLVAISVSDGFFSWLVSIDAPSMAPLMDVGYVVGPTLLALATLVPGPRSPGSQPGSQIRGAARGVVFLPYLPLSLTGLVLAVQLAMGRRIDPIEAGLGLTLVTLVIGRQLVTLLDNVNLLRQVREGQDRLRRQAYTDSLTDLSNRAQFADDLDVEVQAHHAERRPMALLFCDLDDFKFVNDRYGHAAGDELLRAVAGRLLAEARPRDTVARLGGDEFAVLLRDDPDRDLDHADELAQRLLDGLVRPYRLQVPHGQAAPSELTVEVGASIGLVVLDAAAPPVSPDALLARVDAAMYAAKRRGKNRLVTFRGAQVGHDEEPALLGELRLAIAAAARQGAPVDRPDGQPDAGRIDVMYQPVVEFGTSRVAAVEALVRWRHPRHGVLPAGMLISAADEAGVLGELEEHVLLTACRDVGRLRVDAALPELAVHVNVSATRAGDPRLVGTVREALLRHRLPGSALVLEITETNRVPDLDAAAEVLQRIRQLDVRVALDDFGTGYSGLSYLLELPIDIVKLDRSLTVAEPDSRGGTIRQAAAALTLGLGLDLVAEGVETDRQAAQLAGLGCQFGQGFLWSRPAFLPDLDLTRPAMLSH